ncbi:MAG TPA: FKBP-type peptidyl-prolyl cis-trans isomerase [Ilumatobacteraceae bacterium]|nr:FKBP-type peptidyl-prolyl cis-trans isomerase [Ilumatobacteraceae bacterium]
MRPLAFTVLAILALSACGDGTADDATDGTVATTGTVDTADGTTVEDLELIPGDSTTTLPRTAKPVVSVPAAIPTELQITDLVAGTGYAAAIGDTVVVDYVGVRTADGVEFDNSYERGIPYDFPLGQGRVIEGWDQGLIGIQVGTRRQLDVPAELAYGDSPPGGSAIQPGDALTFVIEARGVIPAPDPADAPTDLALEPSVGATELSVVDVVVGTGEPVAAGRTAVIHMLLVQGDTEAILFNTWENGEPFLFELVEGGSIPGLVAGIEGMRVGGRRVITIPFDEAFGPGGDPQLGLPANTDLIVVAELFGLY